MQVEIERVEKKECKRERESREGAPVEKESIEKERE